VVIHVPERVVRGEPRRAAGYATFEGVPEQPLPGHPEVFATEADPQTQTYEVVLASRVPRGEGAAGHVRRPSSRRSRRAGQSVVPLPASAFSPAEGTPQVWIVDAETSRVSAARRDRALDAGAWS
jgi:membrane fusion protein, multidrug efflux system